jgi:translation initiation factor 2B subunit (eIF-2B alpha/beta/delta family)
MTRAAKGKEPDRLSGSVDLLEQAALSVEAHLQKRGTAGLPELLERLVAEHPSMALRHSLAAEVAEGCAKGRDEARQALDRFLTGVTMARLDVAARFSALVHQYKWTSAATYSRSGQVRDCLASARPAGLKSVVLSEARPSCEGALMARELLGEGYDVTLTSDMALPSFLAEVDVLVVGADADIGVFFVNKAGTGTLMREARLKSCLSVVLTLPQKRLTPEQLLSWKNLPMERPKPFPKLPKGISWRGFLFERVPWELANFSLGRKPGDGQMAGAGGE